MSDQETYKKIEEIYNSEKGKGFIEHLIRSFLPTNRSSIMLENTKKKQMRCCITGTSLISKVDVIKFQLENVDAIIKNMADILLSENPPKNIVSENFKGKMIAVECENSERLMTLPALIQLVNFMQTQILRDNKHIHYIVKGMIANQEKNKIKNLESDSVESNDSNKVNSESVDKVAKFKEKYKNIPNKKSPQQKVEKKPVLKSTTSLGDSDFLQTLKKQLESEGK